MKASIIIPTKDKLTRLKLTLQGLEGQIGNEVEVIIVFDGCHPDMIAEFQRLDKKMNASLKNQVSNAQAFNKPAFTFGKVVLFI